METRLVTYKSIFNSSTFNPSVYAVRVIVLYLRKMFELNSDLGYTVYNDDLNKDEALSSLLITTKYDWETKYRNKRPCIMVSNGDIVSGINGTTGIGKIVSITDFHQKISCSDLISFPIVVECLSEVDLEATTLTSLINMFLTASNKPIHSFGFQILGNPIQTASKIFEKGTNASFIASLVLNLQKQRQYSMTLFSLS